MPSSARSALVLVISLVGVQAGALAQVHDEPRPLDPKKPVAKKDLDRREALKLYAIGLVCQRDDRLLEALRAFERALQLDADAAPVYKALIPLYFALERDADALSACRKAVALNPADYETWFVYGRKLKDQGRLKEAVAAYTSGLGAKGLKGKPALRQQMYFELGALHEENRDLLAAAAAFTETVKVLDSPELILRAGPFTREDVSARAADIYERLGRIYTKAKKYEQAVASFRKAQARAGDRVGRLNYNLADVYSSQGKLKEALACLDDYLQLQPQGMEAYEMKIAVLRRLKREGEILPALEEHASRDRFNTALQLVLAREYGPVKPAEAERIYTKLTEGTPAAEVYRGLFALYKSTPRWGMAKVLALLDGTLKKAADKNESEREQANAAAKGRAMLTVLRDDPTLVKPLLTVARNYLRDGTRLAYQTRHFLAVLAGHAKQLDVAERFYKECLDEARPDNAQAIYGGLLKILWLRRKHKDIVAVCEKGLEHTDRAGHFLFHLDLAQALPYLDRGKEALEHADKAVDLAGPDNRLFVQLRRVAVLTHLDEHKRAIAECLALLKDHKQAADAHDIRYALASAYTAARMYPKAEEALERLIEDHPDDATAYNDLGYIWADRNKNLKKAEEHIRKAIELDRKQKKSGASVGTEEDKDNAAYIDSLGWVLFRRGLLEAAHKELEKAASLPNGDDDPVVFDHLGDVCFRLDRPDQARAAWRKAQTLYEVEKRRKMDRRYDEIKQKLKDLKP